MNEDLKNGILPPPKEEKPKPATKVYKRSVSANIKTADGQEYKLKTNIMVRATSFAEADKKISEQFEALINRSFQSGPIDVVKLSFG